MVAAKDKLDVYNFQNMHKLFSLGIASSPHVFALSPFPTSFFAHAPNHDSGTVAVYDLISTSMKATIAAHKAPIKLLAFNPSGNFLATTSTNVSTTPRIDRG